MGDQTNQMIDVLLKIRESFGDIKDEIRRIKRNNESVREENKGLRERLERLERLIQANINHKGSIKERKQFYDTHQGENLTETSSEKEEDALKKEMLSSLKKKRKDIIKMKILGMIRANTMSLPEIKRLVVDELEYCSKATFYRYIKELSPYIKETEVYK